MALNDESVPFHRQLTGTAIEIRLSQHAAFTIPRKEQVLNEGEDIIKGNTNVTIAT